MGMHSFPYHLPNDLMEEFGAFTGLHWCGWEIEAPVCDAIRAYMKPQPAAQAQQGAVADAGYQWKQVFLPEVTRLRASFGRTPYFAVVQGTAPPVIMLKHLLSQHQIAEGLSLCFQLLDAIVVSVRAMLESFDASAFTCARS